MHARPPSRTRGLAARAVEFLPGAWVPSQRRSSHQPETHGGRVQAAGRGLPARRAADRDQETQEHVCCDRRLLALVRQARDEHVGERAADSSGVMNMKDLESSVFEAACNNAKQLEYAAADDVVHALGGIETIIKSDRNLIIRLRERMREANEPTWRLFRIGDEAAPALADARALLDRGDVAAVDGTDAMEQIAFNMTSAYACAVGFLTACSRGKPAMRITTTSTRYSEKERLDQDELASLCDELEEYRIEQSWPTTFREHEERQMALECGAPWVFLDGPVYTRNLVTQRVGLHLYERMARSSQHFIGVIKDLSHSWPLSKWCSAALMPGDGFVVAPLRAQFEVH